MSQKKGAEDPVELLLRNFKSLLFTKEELQLFPPDKPISPLVLPPCEKCKAADSRELPCLHRLCDKCISEHIDDQLTVTCIVCQTQFRYFAETTGFFVLQPSQKIEESKKDQKEPLVVRIFGDNDMLLNFQFAIDFASDPDLLHLPADALSRYFSIFRKDNFQPSDATTADKKRVLVYTFPRQPSFTPATKSFIEEDKVGPELEEFFVMIRNAKLYLTNRRLTLDSHGRFDVPVIAVPGSFLPDAMVHLNFGRNVKLIKRLILRLNPKDEITAEMLIHVKTPEKASTGTATASSPLIAESVQLAYRTQDQLSPEPPLPLTCPASSRFSYKTLTSALYQAPCNDFEEKIMKSQKYKDYTNPIFTLNNDLITKAKEIADSLTSKGTGGTVEPLPRCEDFSFDLYQQIRCKKYRYCTNCGGDGKKDKIMYCRSIWEISEAEREKLATHKCLTCKEYLCPTCANLHKLKNMDHKYLFKVDRNDYYSIRRPRLKDAVRTMNDLIKDKVKYMLEKVNQEVSAHLIDCLNVADGKYAGNT